MISQHLMLRCKKGFYDKSLLAGMKTAAVSDSWTQYTAGFRQELESSIAKAVLPDNVDTPNGGNRGLLRLSYLGDCLIVNRIFRVSDRCDFRGNSTFVHSYCIDGPDREKVLAHPATLSQIKSFDDYQSVNTRCGGLDTNHPIPLNQSLVMPDETASFSKEDVLSCCGKDGLARIITAVCRVLSGSGVLSVLLPPLTEDTWTKEGGSLLGEEIMLSLLQLLPDCLSRFFSGISYWNESNSFYGLEPIKIRFCTPRFLSDLKKYPNMSLIQITDKGVLSSVKPCLFGEYLWDIRNDKEAVAAFHRFIRELFGEAVDTIGKPSKLMDTVTQLYWHQHPDDPLAQSIAGDFIEMFGGSLNRFPNIRNYCHEVIQYCIDHRIRLDEKFEKTLNSTKKLSKPMVQCLMQQIIKGWASQGTIDRMTKLLVSQRSPTAEAIFKEQIQKSGHISLMEDTMLRLMCAYYIDAQEEELPSRLYHILNGAAIWFNNEQDYDHYLFLLHCLFSTERTFLYLPDQLISPEEWYERNCDRMIYLFQENDRYAKAVGEILLSHYLCIKKSTHFILYSELLFKHFFQKANTLVRCQLCRQETVFRVFIKLSIPLISTQTGWRYWESAYREMLAKDWGCFQKTDHFLDDETVQDRCIGLCRVESARVALRQRSSWPMIRRVFAYTTQTRDICQIIDYFYTKVMNKEEILQDMSADPWIYPFVLYRIHVDKTATREELIRYANCLLQREDCFDRLIEAAEDESFQEDVPKAEKHPLTKVLINYYWFFWSVKYPAHNIAEHETIAALCEEEKRLAPHSFGKAIMKSFGRLFPLHGCLLDLPPESVSFVNNCMVKYQWQNICGLDTDEVVRWQFREIIDHLLAKNNLDPQDDSRLDWRYLRPQRGQPDSRLLSLLPFIKNKLEEQTNNDNEPIHEGCAILAVIYVLSMQRRTDKYAWVYLSLLNSGSPSSMHWRSAGYLMLALKYLCMMNDDYFGKLYSFRASCVGIFAEKLMISDGKQHVLATKGTFDQYVKDRLETELFSQLSNKAAELHDEDYKQMFPQKHHFAPPKKKKKG